MVPNRTLVRHRKRVQKGYDIFLPQSSSLASFADSGILQLNNLDERQESLSFSHMTGSPRFYEGPPAWTFFRTFEPSVSSRLETTPICLVLGAMACQYYCLKKHCTETKASAEPLRGSERWELVYPRQEGSRLVSAGSTSLSLGAPMESALA